MENINFRILPTAFRYLAGFFRQNVFSQVQRPRAALERLHRSAPEPADDPPAYRPPKKVPPLATSREDTVRNRSSTRLPTATGGSRAQAANTAVTKTALRNTPRKDWAPRRVTEMGAVAQGVTEMGAVAQVCVPQRRFSPLPVPQRRYLSRAVPQRNCSPRIVPWQRQLLRTSRGDRRLRRLRYTVAFGCQEGNESRVLPGRCEVYQSISVGPVEPEGESSEALESSPRPSPEKILLTAERSTSGPKAFTRPQTAWTRYPRCSALKSVN